MKSIEINPDNIQMCLSVGIVVLPLVYETYLITLKRLSEKEVVCLLPSTVFELYHIHIRRKINLLISSLPKHIQQKYARTR
jgi:hypothetical protein